MDHDPNQPESSSSGQQPPLQSEQSQEPLWYESPPQWGQQLPPQYRQPPDGPPQYGGSPIPDSRPPHQPKKRSRRWLWITLALVGGIVLGCIGGTIVVALTLSSFARLERPVTNARQAVTVTNVRQAVTVTNLNDNGAGSLRFAVDVTPAGGTITFDPRLRGTILLTSGDLNIGQGLMIRGPGAGILSISGGKSGHIVVGGLPVTISGLTIKNSTPSGPGGSGGGIDNFGTLTLSNSTVSGNTSSGPGGPGGGIANFGTLTLNNSTVSGNMSSGPGGGIANFDTLTLNNSTVSGNTSSGPGGGIANFDTLMLNNSTVSGNTSSDTGGGIFNAGGTLIKLNKSTVSGNTPTDISPSP